VPQYVFKCKKCDEKVTKIQKYDDPAPPCTKCKGETERAVAQGSFQLKGSGWFNSGGY